MSIGRALAWPFRRLLDPRFGGLATQADVQHSDLADRFDELSRRVADRDTIAEMFEAIRQELAAMREELFAMLDRELATMRRELAASAVADRETNELMARALGDVLSEVTATRIALEDALGRDLHAASTEPNTAVPASFANEQRT